MGFIVTFLVFVHLRNVDRANLKVSEMFQEILKRHVKLSILLSSLVTFKEFLTLIS